MTSNPKLKHHIRLRLVVPLVGFVMTLPTWAVTSQLSSDAAPAGSGQTPTAQNSPTQSAPAVSDQQTSLTGQTGVPADYQLSPDDQIYVRAPNAEDINEKSFRVDANGDINFLSYGKVHVAGLTASQVEDELVKRLREVIRNPQAVVIVTQSKTEPVFVVGAFRAPGIYPLQQHHSLLDLLTVVGGVLPDASRRIKVTRRLENGPIPIPNATIDPDQKTSSVYISLLNLSDNETLTQDLELKPKDVVSVERAELVYIAGEVGKPGGIELQERDSVSVMQALTLSGGATPFAKLSHVFVLRPVANTTRRSQINIDVARILQGKDNDFPLLANDLLYVPRSGVKTLERTLGYLAIAEFPYIIAVFHP